MSAREGHEEHEKAFAELSADELYAILALRQEVFVVEQACAYLDCDGLDRAARHLWTVRRVQCDEGDLAGAIVAYARILPPGEKFEEASLGRVITASSARRTGVGRAIVARAIAGIERRWGGAIRISAQSYLERFYRELGFERVGEGYLEDGIPHIEMLRASFPRP
ncbi:MAG: GNAT family N-acetyltransferase [Deltaproteobacteria bacterium]|nr:GNAT family N-acetyltransferase [Deltaproteobacteria bacterium]